MLKITPHGAVGIKSDDCVAYFDVDDEGYKLIGEGSLDVVIELMRIVAEARTSRVLLTADGWPNSSTGADREAYAKARRLVESEG